MKRVFFWNVENMATNFLHQFRSVLLVVLISTVGVLSVTGMLKILFLRNFFIFETLWVNCDDSTSGEKISRKNRKTLFGKNCCSAKSSAKISKEIIFLSILHTIVRVILLIEMWVFFCTNLTSVTEVTYIGQKWSEQK